MVYGYGFKRPNSEIGKCRAKAGTPSFGVVYQILKNKATWCEILAGFYAPNKIQLRDYSRGGGVDNISYIGLGGER